MGIVNLKPLLPGHVLIVPKRVVPRLADLNSNEVTDLFLAVQHVGKVLEGVYKAKALTVSLQDGAVAGQSVPHVHIHIIPRHPEDYEGENDRIYPALEQSEAQLRDDLTSTAASATANGINGSSSSEPISMNGAARAGNGNGVDERNNSRSRWPKDEDRKPRTIEEMEKEADWLASFF
ncbi:bis(5'-adenosyl)-triphosphatase [Kwoniella heveanensis CBS 569]|uniref:Bis(5'-adenosyl)-triphosphatase n=1 Tax=Kwoniella heveanensis BCC8398 TaxID=1296120 RepID=A0A1B9GUT6_9TREE|nr:bis(5'-adenosyl)-triphosphatase [Kwoniella heveanensis BCC8398]OCF45075.1 bis(5'-adenosyl)-triphosphatase [Kwoniella heveanensis CBS 569]